MCVYVGFPLCEINEGNMKPVDQSGMFGLAALLSGSEGI